MEIKSSTSLMAEILRSLRVEMNGAVVGAMEDRGLIYQLNYGVSLPTIRNIAKRYAPNHKLAKLLYQQQIRELQIAAIYIAEPNLVTAETAQFWVKGVTNNEIAENIGSALIGDSINCEEVVEVWLRSDNSDILYSALIALSKAIKQGCISEVSKYIEVCGEMAKNSNKSVWRGVELLLVAIATQSTENRELVTTLLKQITTSELNSAQYLCEEVSWQIV